jgi:hypothetical protein
MMKKLGLKPITHAIKWRIRSVQIAVLSSLSSYFAIYKSRLRQLWRRRQKHHGLPGELIISLTSYPPRFGTLLPTLQCLLTQNVKPDRVILWVAHEDQVHLPESILAQTKFGLEIRLCRDLGPYKKIIPTLQEFPKAFIVTADDDLYYHSNWLGDLITSWSGDIHQIVCHRAHRIKIDVIGLPIPYKQWEFDIVGPVQSASIFPTGVSGIFYPPGSLSPEVLDEARFLELSPKADDIWLYWMGRRAGAVYKKTPGHMKLVLWSKSQKIALVNENFFESENDKKIYAMSKRYGWPGT